MHGTKLKGNNYLIQNQHFKGKKPRNGECFQKNWTFSWIWIWKWEEVNNTNNASFLLETKKLCIFHIHVNIVQP